VRQPGETQGPGPLTSLERDVLALILAGPGLEPLRQQAAAATATSRSFSGVGFVTRLAPGPGSPATGAVRLPPAYAEHPQLTERVEFLLQVNNGRLAALEAFCYAGSWPEDESGFRVLR